MSSASLEVVRPSSLWAGNVVLVTGSLLRSKVPRQVERASKMDHRQSHQAVSKHKLWVFEGRGR